MNLFLIQAALWMDSQLWVKFVKMNSDSVHIKQTSCGFKFEIHSQSPCENIYICIYVCMQSSEFVFLISGQVEEAAHTKPRHGPCPMSMSLYIYIYIYVYVYICVDCRIELLCLLCVCVCVWYLLLCSCLSWTFSGGTCLLCADYDYYMAIMRLSFVNFRNKWDCLK